jgi:hypothetical protein
MQDDFRIAACMSSEMLDRYSYLSALHFGKCPAYHAVWRYIETLRAQQRRQIETFTLRPTGWSMKVSNYIIIISQCIIAATSTVLAPPPPEAPTHNNNRVSLSTLRRHRHRSPSTRECCRYMVDTCTTTNNKDRYTSTMDTCATVASICRRVCAECETQKACAVAV